MPKLTYREEQILNLVKEGLTYKEIASRLSISSMTVKADMRLIFARLEAKSAAHAVAIAIRLRIIEV